jgi:hypothetical protein
MPWAERIDPVDDRLHKHDGDPYWNESCIISFAVPERNLCGFLYFYFRPNMNLFVGGPAIWDHTGEDIYNCAYYGWDQHLWIPPGADMYDFQMANTFRCQTIEPLKEYRLGYDINGLRLDLTWTALMEPHYMKLSTGGKLNQSIADWVSTLPEDVWVGHYEQSGWIRGTIELDGERIEVDHGSLRDHGWGPRHADGVQFRSRRRGGWPYAIASDQLSFHCYTTNTFPILEDPVEGTVETITTGYYVRDGLKGQIVEGTRRITDRGPDGRPLREVVEGIDEHGRKLHAVGEMRNWLKFILNTDYIDWWCLVRWEIDGQEVYGETHDYMLFKHWRQYWSRLVTADPGLLPYTTSPTV